MTENPSIGRILLATAFQEMSAATAPYACMIARVHDAELHVLHVVPLPTPSIRAGADAGAAVDVADPMMIQRMDDMTRAAQDRVKEFIATRIVPQGCRATPAAGIGIVWDEIVTYARENQIDLIIMGTRRHGMLHRMLLGSVSKAVVEHAPCPVLLVPLDDRRSDTTADKAA